MESNVQKVTIPLVRLKKCLEKPNAIVIYDIDENMYVAALGSLVYDAYSLTFELANHKR